MGYCIYDNIAEMYLKKFHKYEMFREWEYGNVMENTYYDVNTLHVFKTIEEANTVVDFLETNLKEKGCKKDDIDFEIRSVSIEAVYNVTQRPRG